MQRLRSYSATPFQSSSWRFCSSEFPATPLGAVGFSPRETYLRVVHSRSLIHPLWTVKRIPPTHTQVASHDGDSTEEMKVFGRSSSI